MWPLDGTGLRYVPVNHSGNQSDSPEEVQRIVEIVRELLRGETTWTSKEGETLPLQLKDILIVAPYNAQVSALKEALPGAKVGTVDKFQGQQAPVVFYSMATSTPEDAPRGMEFPIQFKPTKCGHFARPMCDDTGCESRFVSGAVQDAAAD